MNKATKSAPTMTENSLRIKNFQRAAILLNLVSDPTRLQAIAMLSKREYQAGELCDELNISQPSLSHHVAMLRHGGIIECRRDGKRYTYAVSDTGYRLSKLVDCAVD